MGLLCFFILFPLATAVAASGSAVPIRDGDYEAAIVINAKNGDILYEKNAHAQHPPASMVKMMLMLLVMERVRDHSITLDDPVKTSAKASRFGGSQVYLKDGEVFPLKEMMKAIAIHSANDASVAVAEFLTGSVEGCVDLMNRRAQELGMHDTRYYSVDGLPPGRGQKADLSSAYDLSRLAMELVKYPKLLEWTATERSSFRNGEFTLTNTNKLIGNFRGADGLKTGYYGKAGYNLTATASRDGLRIISVIFGASSDRSRVRESGRLLSIGFNMYKKLHVIKKGEPLLTNVKVTGAKVKRVTLLAAKDVFIQVRRGRESLVHRDSSVPASIEAPVVKGKAYGTVFVKNGDRVLSKVKVVAAKEIPKAPLCYRAIFHFFE
jgi:D-alanyl-D-alanine carboxypeptidase (penicillin-binding protein 5/6)